MNDCFIMVGRFKVCAWRIKYQEESPHELRAGKILLCFEIERDTTPPAEMEISGKFHFFPTMSHAGPYLKCK